MSKKNVSPSLIDVPVLLIFMARPEQFKKVFEQVRMAKPSKLFLYQDGPRKERGSDIENIAKCREIAEKIDWNCQVYRFYQEENVGCDPSEYIAQKWMFEHVDRGIILEDDDVPSQSFFPFCKELLNRYANDTRIGYIAGMNHLDQYNNDTDNSYFFTSSGSIWGWATWKRTIDQWDEKLEFINDQNTMRLLKMVMGKNYFNNKKPVWLRHKTSGKAHYESILNSSILLNSQLNIVPSKNLISNIGIAADSTHATDSIKKLPPKIRKLFFMKTHELEFPLKHPKYVINDMHYRNKVLNMLSANDSVIIRKIKNIRNKFIRFF
jgi:hypothetical protein